MEAQGGKYSCSLLLLVNHDRSPDKPFIRWGFPFHLLSIAIPYSTRNQLLTCELPLPCLSTPTKVKGGIIYPANISVCLFALARAQVVISASGGIGHILPGSVVFHVALDQMAGSLSRDKGQLASQDRTSHHRGEQPSIRSRGFPVGAFDAQ